MSDYLCTCNHGQSVHKGYSGPCRSCTHCEYFVAYSPEAQPTSPEREWLNLGERLDAMTKPGRSEKYEALSWMIANDYVTFDPETSRFGNGESFPEALAAYRRHVLADAIEKVEAKRPGKPTGVAYAIAGGIEIAVSTLRDMKGE